LTPPDVRVLIKGAGDLATGTAHRLHRAGFQVFMTEIPEPRSVRRTVCFSECIFRGCWTVEGVMAARACSVEESLKLREQGVIPVMVDPEGLSLGQIKPSVLVDARMAKRNLGTTLDDAPVVVGLGPGFNAGTDVRAVVETARGHYLGMTIYHGGAQPYTKTPGDVGGYTMERLLRAPSPGTLRTLAEIGDQVKAGQVVAEILTPGESLPVPCAIDGLLRGLLRKGAPVQAGQKLGDVDPRCDAKAAWHISDKARSVAGGVLEAVCGLLWGTHPGMAERGAHHEIP
jgi:xanthine dehydrogenase accessory factor